MESEICLAIDTIRRKKPSRSVDVLSCSVFDAPRLASCLTSSESGVPRVFRVSTAASPAASTRALMSADTNEETAMRQMANPSTTATSSSSETCDSEAASSISLAITYDIDTDRSAPIALSAPVVVPPNPGVSAILNDAEKSSADEWKWGYSNAYTTGYADSRNNKVCPVECERAGTEAVTLCTELVGWQADGMEDFNGRGYVASRRLVLAPPYTEREVGKRKERSWKGRDRVFGQMTHSPGATIGATLGNIVAFLQRRGVTSTSAILKQVRTLLSPAARDLSSAFGSDAVHLARAMVALHVVRSQRMSIPELQTRVKIDHKIGNVGTAVGATATLLIVMWTILEAKKTSYEDVSRLLNADVLHALLVQHAKSLEIWNPNTLSVPEDHRMAMESEKRCLQRAAIGCRCALLYSHERDEGADASLRRQVLWARKAAWPPGSEISASSQKNLCAAFCVAFFLHEEPSSVPLGVFPLDAVPLRMLSRVSTDSDTDASSTSGASSASSTASSVHSAVSVDMNVFTYLEI